MGVSPKRLDQSTFTETRILEEWWFLAVVMAWFLWLVFEVFLIIDYYASPQPICVGTIADLSFESRQVSAAALGAFIMVSFFVAFKITQTLMGSARIPLWLAFHLGVC